MSAGEDFLSAPVPRQLRVRGSLQIARTRLPARSFAIVIALVLAGGVAVARGADVAATAQALGLCAAAAIVAVEGRWWGYTTWSLAHIVAAHLARPRRLELAGELVAAPHDRPSGPVRRPRWQATEGSSAEGQPGGRARDA